MCFSITITTYFKNHFKNQFPDNFFKRIYTIICKDKLNTQLEKKGKRTYKKLKLIIKEQQVSRLE